MAEKITKPGIYSDFPEADYFADPCPTPSLTQSIAKLLIESSPAHARLEHPRLAPAPTEDDATEKYVAAQAIGNAAHKIMLGRGREIAEAQFDDFRGKEAKAFRAENEAAGKLVILSKHIATAQEMVKAALAQLAQTEHHDAFEGGAGEIMLAWKEGDLWFRSLVDWMADPCRPYDYKTTGMSVAPHVIAERPSTEGWDIQAAMIEWGLNALDAENAGRRQFHFVAQENFAPYALTVVRISEADLTMGRKKLAFAAQQWAACMANNGWPLYGTETVISRPRGFTETQWLNREIANEDRKPTPRAIESAENIRAG